MNGQQPRTWAVVTGASDGIGRAFATALAAEGRSLVLCARRAQRLNELAEALAQRHGIATDVVAADLATDDGPRRLVEATVGRDVDLLVAAAGFGTSGPFATTDLDEELAMLACNCRAVLVLAHAFAPR